MYEYDQYFMWRGTSITEFAASSLWNPSKSRFSLRVSSNSPFLITCSHLNQFTSVIPEDAYFCFLFLTLNSSVQVSHLGAFRALNFGGQSCSLAVSASLH